MAILRNRLAVESQFTQTPNKFVRDHRLSRRARGLLVEIMSHTHGWSISIESLCKSGPEGRDAIRKAIEELETFGYLTRQRKHDDGGKFVGIDYMLADPFEDDLRETSVGKSDVGKTDVGKTAPKNTSSEEDHSPEHQERPDQRAANLAYEAMDKAANWKGLFGVAKWALKNRGISPEVFGQVAGDLYRLGKPITNQTVGQMLDGHIRRPQTTNTDQRRRAALNQY